jgi:hypothetical protein
MMLLGERPARHTPMVRSSVRRRHGCQHPILSRTAAAATRKAGYRRAISRPWTGYARRREPSGSLAPGPEWWWVSPDVNRLLTGPAASHGESSHRRTRRRRRPSSRGQWLRSTRPYLASRSATTAAVTSSGTSTAVVASARTRVRPDDAAGPHRASLRGRRHVRACRWSPAPHLAGVEPRPSSATPACRPVGAVPARRDARRRGGRRSSDSPARSGQSDQCTAQP